MGTSVYETETEVKLGRSEIVSIPSSCPNCGVPGESVGRTVSDREPTIDIDIVWYT
jgi:hypothetical protein